MASKYEGMKAKMAERLTCSICLLQFDNDRRVPKTFPCQHSICLFCIEDLINQHFEHTYFPCPMCRDRVDVPKEGANGFKTNLALVSMLELIDDDDGGTEEAHLSEGRSEDTRNMCETHSGNVYLIYNL